MTTEPDIAPLDPSRPGSERSSPSTAWRSSRSTPGTASSPGESSDKPEQVGVVFDVCDRILEDGLVEAVIIVHHANVTGLPHGRLLALRGMAVHHPPARNSSGRHRAAESSRVRKGPRPIVEPPRATPGDRPRRGRVPASGPRRGSHRLRGHPGAARGRRRRRSAATARPDRAPDGAGKRPGSSGQQST